MIRILLFLLLFNIVRGLPVLLCGRHLAWVNFASMSLLSATQLPLVVAITDIGQETCQMSPVDARALIRCERPLRHWG
jgi:hypothetical protein